MREVNIPVSSQVYLLLQSTNYLGFRTTICKEPFELHPPVALPYLPNTKMGRQRISSVVAPYSPLNLGRADL